MSINTATIITTTVLPDKNLSKVDNLHQYLVGGDIFHDLAYFTFRSQMQWRDSSCVAPYGSTALGASPPIVPVGAMTTRLGSLAPNRRFADVF
ncbi:hypothetical protein P5V15_010557 [Pogonomyrmex californicus]